MVELVAARGKVQGLFRNTYCVEARISLTAHATEIEANANLVAGEIVAFAGPTVRREAAVLRSRTLARTVAFWPLGSTDPRL
jgi:hypothetical protein